MIIFDVDCIGCHFRRRVAVADVPGGLHQTSGIFGTNFDELLRRSPDQNKSTIFKLQRIAIVQHGCFLEIEQELGP